MALGYWSTIVGWSLPANSLLLIDKDIGPSKNITWVALSNTLGLSVSFLLVGRLSDIFGELRMCC
jgi:MFS family permease